MTSKPWSLFFPGCSSPRSQASEPPNDKLQLGISVETGLTTTRSFAPFYGLAQVFVRRSRVLDTLNTDLWDFWNVHWGLCAVVFFFGQPELTTTNHYTRVFCRPRAKPSCSRASSTPPLHCSDGSVPNRTGEASTTIRSECSFEITEQDSPPWMVHTGMCSLRVGPCQCFPSAVVLGARGTNSLVCDQVPERINTEWKPIQSKCQSPENQKMGQL